MGKWLTRCLSQKPTIATDTTDTVPSVSSLSVVQASISQETSENLKEFFQERAAIREFDGEQSRVEAELGALEEVMPYLGANETLHIPPNSPKKYHWWNGGQSIEATLCELGASQETIDKYVSNYEGKRKALS